MLITAMVCISLLMPMPNQTGITKAPSVPKAASAIIRGTTPPPSGPVTGTVKKKDITTPVTTPVEKKVTVEDLVKSIEALEYKSLKLSAKYKLKIAKAALSVGTKLKVDPYLLIALSRMESDFMAKSELSISCYKRGRGCQADCGITQHNFTGSRRYVINRCKKLKQNPALAMTHSAKELRRHVVYCGKKIKQCKIYNKIKCAKARARCRTSAKCKARAEKTCKWLNNRKCYHEPRMRCVLNRYNQGTFYKRYEKCQSMKRDWWLGKAGFKKRQRKCKHLASYWTKTMCFYYGAKNKVSLKRSCRRCYATKKIPWFYKTKGSKYSLPKFVSVFF